MALEIGKQLARKLFISYHDERHVISRTLLEHYKYNTHNNISFYYNLVNCVLKDVTVSYQVGYLVFV